MGGSAIDGLIGMLPGLDWFAVHDGSGLLAAKLAAIAITAALGVIGYLAGPRIERAPRLARTLAFAVVVAGGLSIRFEIADQAQRAVERAEELDIARQDLAATLEALDAARGAFSTAQEGLAATGETLEASVETLDGVTRLVARIDRLVLWANMTVGLENTPAMSAETRLARFAREVAAMGREAAMGERLSSDHFTRPSSFNFGTGRDSQVVYVRVGPSHPAYPTPDELANMAMRFRIDAGIEEKEDDITDIENLVTRDWLDAVIEEFRRKQSVPRPGGLGGGLARIKVEIDLADVASGQEMELPRIVFGYDLEEGAMVVELNDVSITDGLAFVDGTPLSRDRLAGLPARVAFGPDGFGLVDIMQHLGRAAPILSIDWLRIETGRGVPLQNGRTDCTGDGACRFLFDEL